MRIQCESSGVVTKPTLIMIHGLGWKEVQVALYENTDHLTMLDKPGRFIADVKQCIRGKVVE
ncbi:hypothetical protein AB1K91_17225 [Terribacillus sp. 179-K 1B1 HS]|uniref:hypothetical protein n=1 Tax=Terribacillus sp. 179-K 1B1 HS TaxID=3142388 RepID=UPI0039A31CD2